MKIYCAHSSGFDYQNEWYGVLRESDFAKSCVFIFPHELEDVKKNSYSTIDTCDYFIAEVSHPSIGLGIEIGSAHSLGKPIFCFYKIGSRLSPSLQAITKNCFSYSTSEELVHHISHLFSHEMNHPQ